jgi:CheY-like chemotaxis protein
LLNLVSNAIKYNRPGGSAALSCERSAETGLRIKVHDTGPGIRPEHLGLLFTPFERLGAEHTNVEGTGIGLALSRRLAEAMGGTLDVETNLGQGTTFWVELPVVEGPVERYVRLNGHDELSTPPVVHTKKVLHIEDNASNLRLVERILARDGEIELVSAMQGRLGVELAREHRPALILLDLHLPDIAGDEVLRQLRDDPQTAAIPVVVVSADATPGQIRRLLAEGASAYLTKPLDVGELRLLVDGIPLPTA